MSVSSSKQNLYDEELMQQLAMTEAKSETKILQNTTGSRRRRNTLSSRSNSGSPVLTKKDTLSDLRRLRSSSTDKLGTSTPTSDLAQKARDLEVKVAELELEKLKFLTHTNTLNNEHKKQVEALQRESKQLKEERDKALNRLSTFLLVEEGIIELYVEMKDRSHEDPGEEPNFDGEKERLRKKQNPLVVMDLLRSELKTLQAFKEEFENELKGELKKRKTAIELQNEQMKKTLKDLKEAHDKMLQEHEDAAAKIKEATTDKERTIYDYNRLQEKYDRESRQKNEESRRLQNENELLKSQLQDKEKVIKDNEMLLAKAKEWENSVEALKQKQKTEAQKVQKQFNVDLQKKQLEVDSLNQELVEKRKLEGKLKWAHEQLANSVNSESNMEVTKKVERLTKTLEEQREVTKKAEDYARKSKVTVDELQKKNEQLKKEIKVLKISQVKRSKMETPLDMHSKEEEVLKLILKGLDFRHAVDNNHSHLEVYKNLLKEKEKELAQVNNRLRRMLMAWNRGQLYKKSAWMERSNLNQEVETLRTEVQSYRAMNSSPRQDNEVKKWMDTFPESEFDAAQENKEATSEEEDEEYFRPIQTSRNASSNIHERDRNSFKRPSTAESRLPNASSRGASAKRKPPKMLIGSNHSTLLIGSLLSVP